MITVQISPLIRSQVLNKFFEHSANSITADLLGSLARKHMPAAILYIKLSSYKKNEILSVFVKQKKNI